MAWCLASKSPYFTSARLARCDEAVGTKLEVYGSDYLTVAGMGFCSAPLAVLRSEEYLRSAVKIMQSEVIALRAEAPL